MDMELIWVSQVYIVVKTLIETIPLCIPYCTNDVLLFGHNLLEGIIHDVTKIMLRLSMVGNDELCRHVVAFVVITSVLFSERMYSASRNIPPSFTVRRTFTVRNTGPLPIYIDKMMIGGAECEGYGFKIIDCTSFDLLPNDSHKVDIMLVSMCCVTR